MVCRDRLNQWRAEVLGSTSSVTFHVALSLSPQSWDAGAFGLSLLMTMINCKVHQGILPPLSLFVLPLEPVFSHVSSSSGLVYSLSFLHLLPPHMSFLVVCLPVALLIQPRLGREILSQEIY